MIPEALTSLAVGVLVLSVVTIVAISIWVSWIRPFRMATITQKKNEADSSFASVLGSIWLITALPLVVLLGLLAMLFLSVFDDDSGIYFLHGVLIAVAAAVF